MEALAAFGPYTILRAIAAGTDSVSFAARFEGKKDQEHILALKVLRPELTSDEAFAAKLLDEMRMAVRLNHVNVAQTFDFGRAPEGPSYVALEFVDGVPLGLLQAAVDSGQKAVTTEVAAFICAEACAGLAYAHGRRDERGKLLGITHSRVTPRTVLMSKSGLVKVVDFGLGRALTAAEKPLTDVLDQHFVAPEVLRGEAFDQRADIFSIGALAYLLFTGQHIYEDATGDELDEKARRGYVPAIRDIDGAVPEDIAVLVDQALSSDPEKRFADATELRSGLAAWLRRNSPGFGRHRLKTYLNRLLPATTYGLLPGSEWETLHRKHFRPYDADSLIHESIETDATISTTKDDITPLLENPDVPGLGELDVARMATGAHPSVLDRAHARATVRTPATQRRPSMTGRPRKVRTPPPMPTVPIIPVPQSTAAARTAPKSADEPVRTPAPDVPEVFASRTPPELDAPAAQAKPSVVSAPPKASAAAAPAEDDELNIVIPTDVPEREGIEIDPNLVYDDSIDYGDQVLAVAEADALTRPPRSWGSIIGVVFGIALLAGLAFGGKWFVDQQAAIAGATTAPQVSVFVTSRPQGAAIVVDGQDTGLITPAPLRSIPAATASVTVRMAGFDPAAPQTLDPAVPPGQMQFQLEPAEHRIRVDSDPQGAEVIHDGEVVGVTPMQVGPVRRDYRQGVDLVLRMDGYFDEHLSVDWAPDQGESSVRRPLRVDPNYVPPEPTGDET